MERDLHLYEVRKNGMWGYINSRGEILVQAKYVNVGTFSEGLGYVIDDRRVLTIIDANVEMLGHVENIDYAHRFSCGLLCVERNGKMGFVDRSGEIVIDFSFDLAVDFVQNLAIVHIGDSFGIIERDGRYRVPMKHAYLCPFYADSTVTGVRLGTENWRLIDLHGEIVESQRFAAAQSEREGLVPVRLPGTKWGWADVSGEIVFAPKFDQLSSAFFDGTIGFERRGKWGVVHRSGSILVNPIFSHVGDLCSDRRRVYVGAEAPNVLIGGKYGYLDETGEMCIEPRFDTASDFGNGAARVFVGKRKHALLGWINRDGEYFWEPQG